MLTALIAAICCCNPCTCNPCACEVAMVQDMPSMQMQCTFQPEPASAKVQKMDYAGVRYGFCCPDCVSKFAKNPQAGVEASMKKEGIEGEFLFDPVSGKRITSKQAKGGSMDFNSVRYLFESEANFKTFAANPKAFTAPVTKVALYCPVMGHAVKSYAESGAFADYNGTRYFLCCPDCLSAFQKEPGKFAPKAAAAVMAPKAMPAPKESK